MSDIARLVERLRALHAELAAPGNWSGRQTSAWIGAAGTAADEAATALERLAAEVERLERVIAEHNGGLQASCDAQQKAGHCDAYISRGRACVDCPREWNIDRATRPAAVGERPGLIAPVGTKDAGYTPITIMFKDGHMEDLDDVIAELERYRATPTGDKP